MNRLRTLVGTLVAGMVMGCGPSLEIESADLGPDDVATSSRLLAKPKAVKDEYIVVLKSSRSAFAPINVAQTAQSLAARYQGQVFQTYQHALQGFAVTMTEAQVKLLSNDPLVEYVEPNGIVTMSAIQSGVTWGIDRIDQNNLPLSKSYNYNVSGEGVHAYIIDTGMRATHQQFAGRMGDGFDSLDDGQNTNDCQGHGTHVAGTVGGSTWGVAKAVTFHPIRVLNCEGSGTDAQVIAGIDWVTANHVKPAVANMSLGGEAAQALDDSVRNSIAAGITYALAAGNDNADACNGSPARTLEAITVGSSTRTDRRSMFSSWGTCVDIFAPGSSITSASNANDTGSQSMSGTSMAAPHVAGAAALYLSAHPEATPAEVAEALTTNATKGKIGSPGTGSPNALLYTGFIQ